MVTQETAKNTGIKFWAYGVPNVHFITVQGIMLKRQNAHALFLLAYITLLQSPLMEDKRKSDYHQ